MSTIKATTAALVDLKNTISQHMDGLEQMTPEQQAETFQADLGQLREVIQMLSSIE